MSAGGLYIYLVLGCFTLVAALIAVFTLALYIGHRLEQRRTGSSAGFLEYHPPEPPAPPEKKV